MRPAGNVGLSGIGRHPIAQRLRSKHSLDQAANRPKLQQNNSLVAAHYQHALCSRDFDSALPGIVVGKMA
ncbi:hypothetical protein [Bradyrhizobium sp. AZCC 2289]|uniref:hypothetical protein n=1 Tax=Bradyrhizobium sp. AZCC 2289 TaxID=3117026 RepID=UPI002FF411F2